MNEVYTDLEQINIIDRINGLLSQVSRELGIRNLNDNITITVNCSEEETKRIENEIYKAAEKMGIVHKIDKVDNPDLGRIRITSFQSPLGKLNLIPNGK